MYNSSRTHRTMVEGGTMSSGRSQPQDLKSTYRHCVHGLYMNDYRMVVEVVSCHVVNTKERSVLSDLCLLLITEFGSISHLKS